MELFNMFPIPVARLSLGRQITANELAVSNNMKRLQNAMNSRSESADVLALPEMENIRAFITASLTQYLQDIYAPSNGTTLAITQSWLNYTQNGQAHHQHNHANSFVSGVFYFKADRAVDRFNMVRSGYEALTLPTKTWNIYNSPSWWLEVGAGDLLLFPSSLIHFVERVSHEEERVSLAFNTFPVGALGDTESLTHLVIGNVAG